MADVVELIDPVTEGLLSVVDGAVKVIVLLRRLLLLLLINGEEDDCVGLGCDGIVGFEVVVVVDVLKLGVGCCCICGRCCFLDLVLLLLL